MTTRKSVEPAPMSNANDFPSSAAVILLGGPHQTDNHFRPLSLDLPKPLFPVAGQEMLSHHLEACAVVPNLKNVYLIGSYDQGLFSRFLDSMMKTYDNMSITYLKEDPQESLGTAGGLRQYKDTILSSSSSNVSLLFVLHCDICCTFPLKEMMRSHLATKDASVTLLGKRVFADEVLFKYGCLVSHPETRQVMHWAEKPETFVSDVINCGIYLMNASDLLNRISSVGDLLSSQRSAKNTTSSSNRSSRSQSLNDNIFEFSSNTTSINNLRLEQDVLMPMLEEQGNNSMYVFETGDFWCQIKTPGMALLCSEMYMQRFRYTKPSVLASSDKKSTIEGNVVIHPTATVHESAKIGPNVTIAAGAVIGKGVRVAHSIILEGVTVHAHACVMFSILGWNSVIGQWGRIEGAAPSSSSSSSKGDLTIFGVSVVTAPEVVIRNCIVLPHKQLNSSFHNEILL